MYYQCITTGTLYCVELNTILKGARIPTETGIIDSDTMIEPHRKWLLNQHNTDRFKLTVKLDKNFSFKLF